MFGLDIYILILDDTFTDGRLNGLFAKLPERCIILLEDVDAAGLDRDTINKDKNDAKLGSGKTSGVSLSGFLNVTDGVGSQEGRILIMTTN
jgi:chaperone BCS1